MLLLRSNTKEKETIALIILVHNSKGKITTSRLPQHVVEKQETYTVVLTSCCKKWPSRA
jgi:hypothetical protein